MLPETIGRYQIKSELGRGGMASVYFGFDPRFKREVAVKVLPREFQHDPLFQARFQREAETIAGLEHPAIVPVYDFGEEAGQPYLVMRYMPNGSLADWIKRGPMPLPEVAHIIERLAPALDEAHAKGIVHRDLKPGNILFDQRNDAYLSDFGIVKLSTQASASNLTGDGVVGTPAYMSPEQARGEVELDGRSDVYALGTILFEMLTGVQPFRAETPIGVIVKHLSDPVPSILAVRPDLPDDMEEIAAKALTKDRDKRYQTAGDLAMALSALVHGQSVSDLQYSTIPIPFPAVSPADGPATARGLGGAAEATRDHKAEVTLEHQAEATIAAVPGRRPPNWLLFVGGGLGVVVVAAFVSLAVASLSNSGQFGSSTQNPDGGSGQAGPVATLSAASFAGVAPSGAAARLGKGTLNAAALSPDGSRLAVVGGAGVYLYDYHSFEQVWIGQTGRPVSSLAFSPDGKSLAAGLDNGELLLLNASNGDLIWQASPHADLITGVAFSPTANQIATAGADSIVNLIDATSGETIRSLTGHTARVLGVVFSPDGQHIISASEDKTAIVWNTDSDESRQLVGHSNWVFGAAYSPDGNTVVTASLDGTLIAWDAASGEQVRSFQGPGEGLVSVAFSPDGKWVVSGGSNGELLKWDVQQASQVGSMHGHSGWIANVGWSPDSMEIISGSFDNTVIVWDSEGGQRLRTLTGHTDFMTAVAYGPVIATGSARGEIMTWDAQSRQPQVLVGGHTDQVNGIAISADGNRLASASSDKTVIVWNLETGRKVYVLTGHPGRVEAAAFNSDGSRLASASCADPDTESNCTGGEIRLWDMSNGQLVGDPLVGHASVITALAWLPDGVTLISASADGTLAAWNTVTGQQTLTFEGHSGAVNAVSVSPDGKLIASGANDSNVIVWDASTGQPVHTLVAHTRDVRSVAFSPSENVIASGSDDATVILWDAASGELLLQLTGHNSDVRRVAWSPDGKILVSGSTDGTAILWNAP